MAKSIRAWLAIVGIAALIGCAGFLAYGWRSDITDPPSQPASFSPELIARGEVLANAGFCGECHNGDPTRPFAGGRGLESQFGTIYSTNITPDPETGIGKWSQAAFARAMREGVRKDGAHLFPAFPYDHFALLNDDDINALYAFFMTRTPLVAENRESTLPFPLNIRFLQAGWKLLFVKQPREPETALTASQERGRYLVEGIAHCGACHTPRNLLGAEIASRHMDGADIDGWTAPAINGKSPAPTSWTPQELTQYLRSGYSKSHGSAAGPMSPVIHGLSALPDDDIEAISNYLLLSIGKEKAEPDAVERRALEVDAQRTDVHTASNGERLYVTACATCHFNALTGAIAQRPELGLNSSLFLDKPDNLIHVILDGINAQDGAPGLVMPAFRQAFDDREIASLVNYLRSSRTDLAPWNDVEGRISEIRTKAAFND
ncbi:cytochrome c [Agrobacterium tumefaciens]|uniref:c-type cytochrome n=1 Tax=Agrobacterium tumefaciens TaxID=358 RepID=UPI00287EEE12|nr:cytochrome c [Agrobacterium tumefaciens]MDS7595471.1 cytochrome c [Agrobacterium tumefaciens]